MGRVYYILVDEDGVEVGAGGYETKEGAERDAVGYAGDYEEIVVIRCEEVSKVSVKVEPA